MKPTLVILAAGMGSRYGGLKQLDAVGPSGETILDYSIFDAVRAGFGRVVFVIRHDFEDEFKKNVGSKYQGIVEVDYAFQRLEDLPAGFQVPEGRTKPWGTGHAIRAARDVVKTPFAAINADDFYGRDAFAKLGAFLSSKREPFSFAMVGYLLSNTLSDNGSVARGICSVDADNRLSSVTEFTKLARVSPDCVENNLDGKIDRFTGAERVSMNLWGFGPELFVELEERFPAWLKANGNEMKSEWYIPFIVDELIGEKKATVDVLPTDSTWFGVTYREDRPMVVESIRKLVESGEYPNKLW